MIPQITSANNFGQWLATTQILVDRQNYVEDVNTNITLINANVTATATNVYATWGNVISANANTHTTATNVYVTWSKIISTNTNVHTTADNVYATLANVIILHDDTLSTNANVHATAENVYATWVNVLTFDYVPKVNNDTSTDSDNRYILFSQNTSGTLYDLGTSNTKLYYNPSTGTLNATNFNSLSDERLKNHIITIRDATETVKQLNGVSFRWNDSNRMSYGVIAQELERVLPELVSGFETKTVNYSGITAFLINAVKELDARVAELEKKIQ